MQRRAQLLDVDAERFAEAQALVVRRGARPENQVVHHLADLARAFASDIFHLGVAGAGQVGKIVNNLILWACTSANDEGLRLGEALGVDAEELRAALHHSSAQNWAMDQRSDLSGMPWAEKDMSIVLHEADLARLSLPLCGTVKETIKGLKIRLGYGLPRGSD